MFGQVFCHFAGAQRADFETEHLCQERRGGTKTEPASFFHRAACRPAGAGLIKMTRDDDFAIERLIVTGGGLFAVPSPAVALDCLVINVAALQDFASQFFPNVVDDLLDSIFGLVETFLRYLFKIYLAQGDRHLLGFGPLFGLWPLPQ